MSCQAIKTDSYRVVVNFPLLPKERCQLRLRICFRCLCRCVGFLAYHVCVGLFSLLILGLGPSFCWLVILVGSCHKPPMRALEDVDIRSMTVYQNTSVATPEDQWQVKSDFNVTLSAWNRNSVAGCFSTYRRMVVYVVYHDNLILQQEMPLGFGLKPRRSRDVVVQVEGDHFPVARQVGKLLDAEM